MTDTMKGAYLNTEVMRIAFPVFKYGVYTLLAINIYFFFIHATLQEAFDSAAWIGLVMVMEYETRSLDQDYIGPIEKYLILVLRLACYAFIIYAWWFYFQEAMWLDFVNASAWLLICATIEYDVYFPGEFEAREWKIRNGIKIALYGILFICAIIWGTAGEVLDFYDAFLWIMAFFVIELNIFGFESRRTEPVVTSADSPTPATKSELNAPP